MTHASFRKNFLQDGNAPANETSIPPVAKEGGSGAEDGKDEEIVESEEQQQTLDVRHNETGADDEEDAAVSMDVEEKDGEWYIRYKWMQYHETDNSRVVS